MAEKNIGEMAERRRNRQAAVLIGMALLAAALQLVSALVADNAADGAGPVWLTVLTAVSLGALMVALFRLGDRVSDEFKRRQVALVATNMMKALFVFYPVWLVLQHGQLVPGLSATALFGGQAAVMLLTLIWCRLRG